MLYMNLSGYFVINELYERQVNVAKYSWRIWGCQQKNDPDMRIKNWRYHKHI